MHPNASAKTGQCAKGEGGTESENDTRGLALDGDSGGERWRRQRQAFAPASKGDDEKGPHCAYAWDRELRLCGSGRGGRPESRRDTTP